MSDDNSLSKPWIIVIVFGIIISAQSMYIFLRYIRDRETPIMSRARQRPRTEYYDLSRQPAPRGESGRAIMRTGYSPQVPPPIAGGRW